MAIQKKESLFSSVTHWLQESGYCGITPEQFAKVTDFTPGQFVDEMKRLMNTTHIKDWIEYNPSTRAYTLHSRYRKIEHETLNEMIRKFHKEDLRNGRVTKEAFKSTKSESVIHKPHESLKDEIENKEFII